MPPLVVGVSNALLVNFSSRLVVSNVNVSRFNVTVTSDVIVITYFKIFVYSIEHINRISKEVI